MDMVLNAFDFNVLSILTILTFCTHALPVPQNECQKTVITVKIVKNVRTGFYRLRFDPF